MTEQPMRVFLDTDIGPDCDDTAALAILLQLCREGKAQLLGVTHCTGSPYGLAAIDSICRLFGVQVPVGTCPDRGFLSDAIHVCYTRLIAERFEHGYPPESAQPDAVDALMKGLKDAPDGSVTLVTIGPLNNAARFLAEPETAEMLRRKVCRIVCMAGSFVEARNHVEWNVEMDVPAMQTVAREWKGPLDLCPFEPLMDVLTGAVLKKYPESPVSLSYRVVTEDTMLRPSWDLETVAAAVLGMGEGPFAWSEPGKLNVDDRGMTRLIPDVHGNCRVLERTGTAEEAVVWLDEILDRAAKTMAGEAD